MLASSMSATILSLLMLAGFALGGGGVWLLAKKRESRSKAWLMIVAAVVMFVNVAIWVAPV